MQWKFLSLLLPWNVSCCTAGLIFNTFTCKVETAVMRVFYVHFSICVFVFLMLFYFSRFRFIVFLIFSIQNYIFYEQGNSKIIILSQFKSNNFNQYYFWIALYSIQRITPQNKLKSVFRPRAGISAFKTEVRMDMQPSIQSNWLVCNQRRHVIN